jgi:ATP-binding cassette, subfamily B, bacterial PglK
MWHFARDCFLLLSPADRLRWLRLVPLIVLTSATEAVGAMGIFVLVAALVEPESLARLPMVGSLIGGFAATEPKRLAVGLAAAVFLFYLAKSFLFAVTEYAQAIASARTAANLSVRMLTGYLRAPYLFHTARSSADLVHTTQRVAGAAFGIVVSAMVHIFTEVLVFIAIVTVLVVAAPVVTLIATAALLIVGGLIIVGMRRVSSHLGEQSHQLSEASMREQTQALGAVEEIVVLGRADGFAQRFARISHSLARVNAKVQFFAALPRIAVETVFICGALGVTVALILLGASSTRTVSLLGLFAYAGFRIIPSANRLLYFVHTIRAGKAGVDRLRLDLREIEAQATPATVACGGRRFTDRVELRAVWLTYPDQERPALADVDLVIPLGRSVAIVGPTGSGKSSLVRLLVGLLRPDRGDIAVDGEPLTSCLGSWRAQIGYVPQEVHLVEDSLRHNVAFGIADADVDESGLRSALRRARLDELVGALPAGAETMVGDRGVRLSGGERQRVGIARAVYHRPRILVLDEATSSLDPRTEAEVLAALRSEREGVAGETLIAVTHRLNSVRGFDRIAFLLDGRVRAVGTFDELHRDVAEFRRMAMLGESA